MDLLYIEIDRTSAVPLYQQIAHSIRNSIETGILSPRQQLMSTRELAALIGVSRPTVCRAYDLLAQWGMIEPKERNATIVSALVHNNFSPEDSVETEHDKPINLSFELSRFAIRLRKQLIDGELSEALNEHFRTIVPPHNELPASQWWHLCAEVSKELSLNIVQSPSLRTSVSDLLKRTKAIRCSVDEVAPFPNIALALEHIARLIIEPGEIVAMTSPICPLARSLFQLLGAKVIEISGDENGINFDRLQSLPQPPKCLYICPSSPRGFTKVMDREQRKKITQWARKTSSIIIENDSQAFLSYSGASIPVMRTMAPDLPIFYLIDFARVLYPLCTSAVAVFPKSLATFSQISSYLDQQLLEELILSRLISKGTLESYLRKLRKRNSSLQRFSQKPAQQVISSDCSSILLSSF